MENFCWETFVTTGNIDAYLLYKSVYEMNNSEDKNNRWQTSMQKVL